MNNWWPPSRVSGIYYHGHIHVHVFCVYTCTCIYMYYVEEKQLKQRIAELSRYRKNGITKMEGQ